MELVLCSNDAYKLLDDIAIIEKFSEAVDSESEKLLCEFLCKSLSDIAMEIKKVHEPIQIEINPPAIPNIRTLPSHSAFSTIHRENLL